MGGTSAGDTIFVLLVIAVLTTFAFSTYEEENAYVGSEKCARCHKEKYDSWKSSRHSKMLISAEDAMEEGYPLPPGYSWDDISYVVGGKWKLRYIDKDGYLVTGENVQYDIERNEWGPFYGYHENVTEVPYDCARCHTTGYHKDEKNELPGIVGTWEENGIGCERCHGPGYLHIKNPNKYKMTVNMDSELCAPCHTQGDWYYINKDRRHHSQYNDFYNSIHYQMGMECIDCHDPHSVSRKEYENYSLRENVLNPQPCFYEGWDGDIKTNDYSYYDNWEDVCLRCHDKKMTHINAGNETVKPTCTDCHMAKSRKSAHKWDISSHTFEVDDEVTYDVPPEKNFPNLTCYYKCHRYYHPLSEEELLKRVHKEIEGSAGYPSKHKNMVREKGMEVTGLLSSLLVLGTGAVSLFWRRIKCSICM